MIDPLFQFTAVGDQPEIVHQVAAAQQALQSFAQAAAQAAQAAQQLSQAIAEALRSIFHAIVRWARSIWPVLRPLLGRRDSMARRKMRRYLHYYRAARM